VPVTSMVAGDRGSLKATLTNPTTRAMTGKLLIEGELFRRRLPPVAVQLPAQKSVEAEVPLEIASVAERRCYTTHLRFEGSGFTVRRPLELLIVSPFEASARLRGAAVHLSIANAARSAQKGDVVVSGAPWREPISRPLAVEGGTKAEFDLPVQEGWSASELTELTVEIKCGQEVDRQSLWVRPLVLNGGFERGGAANRPADWNYQSQEQASTDTTDPAEGKACLKLVGKPGLFVEADQVLSVEPGRTYEARCKLRRTAGEAGSLGPAIVLFLKAGGERYVHLPKVTQRPDDQWNDCAGSFTVADDVARVALYLYNVDSQATVWYEEVRVE